MSDPKELDAAVDQVFAGADRIRRFARERGIDVLVIVGALGVIGLIDWIW